MKDRRRARISTIFRRWDKNWFCR